MNTPGNKAAKQAKSTPPPIDYNLPWNNKSIVLILGAADCVYADKDRAISMFKPDMIMCTNEMGRDYPESFDHWCSMHPDKLKNWHNERRKAGRPDAGQLWCPQYRTPPKEIASLVRGAPSWGGSTGLLCCVVVLKVLNCRAVLAGVPMQMERAHYNNPKPWMECNHYLTAWTNHAYELKGRITSMSGWTKELLGEPTPRWLNGSSTRP